MSKISNVVKAVAVIAIATVMAGRSVILQEQEWRLPVRLPVQRPPLPMKQILQLLLRS